MPADIICIHRGEDGTVCGMPVDGALHANPFADHIGVPGRKCPTCLGSGGYWSLWGERKGELLPCPECADSPVRGYLGVS